LVILYDVLPGRETGTYNPRPYRPIKPLETMDYSAMKTIRRSCKKWTWYAPTLLFS